MVYRYCISMRLQYPTVQDALGAAKWLETWKTINYASVRPAGTVQDAHALIPPTPPNTDEPGGIGDQPANGELTFTVHLDVPDQATANSMYQEVAKALGTIKAEGGVFDCIGDSGDTGTGPE